MAAAARPGSSASGDARDARIPCPLCGGLIHPIAGKCKHCKADLTSYRSARPAASAPLPPLHHPASAPSSNGHAPSAAVAHAVPLPPVALPVLPVRPTSRAATAEPGGGAWRSWPMIVIAVAVLAIVAAVVLMMWPEHRGRDGKRTLAPPPAPEHMDTQTPPVTPRLDAPRAAPPGQPHAQVPPAADPPADPGPQVDPGAGPGADPSADATDDDADPDPDPSGAPGRRTRNHAAVLHSFGGALGFAVIARMCRKLIQCGTSDDVLGPMCALGSQVPPLVGCPAAERCLRRIDAIDCASQPDPLQLTMLLMRFPDCAAAVRC